MWKILLLSDEGLIHRGMSKDVTSSITTVFCILRTESEEMKLIWGKVMETLNNFPNSELKNTAY